MEQPSQKQPSAIKNKLKRAAETAKLRVEKKKAKKKRQRERRKEQEEAEAAGQPVPVKLVPRTIENSREYEQGDTLSAREEQPHPTGIQDEEHPLGGNGLAPKVLITSCFRPTKIMYRFIGELLEAIPGSQFYERRSYEVKQIIQYAKNRDFTALVVVNENQKNPNGLLLVALPDGPTANFRLSSLVLSKKIKNHGRPSSHRPELILNNFTTRLGHKVATLLGVLFPQGDPQYKGRRVITFHNQRDFIFFRHHRYVFQGDDLDRPPTPAALQSAAGLADEQRDGEQGERESSGKSGAAGAAREEPPVITRLQECGPRFTLKLLSLQLGTFDSKRGEYEWVHRRKSEKDRLKFSL